jgi:hypothetical protein
LIALLVRSFASDRSPGQFYDQIWQSVTAFPLNSSTLWTS